MRARAWFWRAYLTLATAVVAYAVWALLKP
jgi:hypothetical protein